MKCISCGSELKVGAKFCAKCGTATSLNNLSSQQATKQKPMKTRIIVAIIVLIAISVVVFSGRSYKTTLKQYVDATMNGDAKKVVSLMPKEYVEEAIRSGEYDSKSELINDLDDALKYTTEALKENFGKRWKYSYEIDNVHTYSKDDMDMYFYYFDYGDISKKVDEIKEMEYTITISGDGEEGSASENILLYKIGRSWYISSPV